MEHSSIMPSFFLPKDLMEDLAMNEDIIINEYKEEKEKQSNEIVLENTNIKRSISHKDLHYMDINDEIDFEQNRKCSSLPFQRNVQYHPFNLLSFEEIFNDTNYYSIFISMLSNRNGSQYLQKKLITASQRDIDIVFISLFKNNSLKTMLCDNYANYFLQQLIIQSQHNHRILLLNAIKENFYEISRNISGTHCIQKLIDKITEPEEEELIKKCIIEFSNLFDFCIESNSTHVIYRLVNGKKLKQRKYLFTFLRQNLPELSKTVNGSTIIRKLFIEITSTKMIKKIIKILETHFFDLSQNKFGNYIIQDAFVHFDHQLCQGLTICLIKNAFNFSLQKYASNVIDKVAIILRSHNETNLFNQLVNTLFIDKNNLAKLLQNKFGTFVVKNIFNLLTFQEKNFLFQCCKFDMLL